MDSKLSQDAPRNQSPNVSKLMIYKLMPASDPKDNLVDDNSEGAKRKSCSHKAIIEERKIDEKLS